MKKILISIITILVIVSLFGCGNIKSKDKQEKTGIERLKEVVEIDGLTFKNDTAEYKDNETQFSSTIKNTTNEEKHVEYVKATITYKTEEGEEQIVDLLFYFGADLKKGEEATTLTSIDLDITKTVKVEYQLYNGGE